jgi:hypothetical protein
MSFKAKDEVQPVRLYQRLDSIAEARRHSDLQERQREVRTAEASASAMPVNPGGWADPGRAHMLAQVAELAAQKREQIKFIESLTGDDLCRMYASDIIAQNEAPPVTELRNSDNSPLRRGGQPAAVPPGMFQAS